jgi:hypothetical protein
MKEIVCGRFSWKLFSGLHQRSVSCNRSAPDGRKYVLEGLRIKENGSTKIVLDDNGVSLWGGGILWGIILELHYTIAVIIIE